MDNIQIEISDKDILLSQSELLHEYNQQLKIYNDFKNDAQQLLEKIFANSNIKMLPIKARIKDVDSLKEKIVKKAKKYPNPQLYKSLSDITDILGIRIILYLKNDLHEVINTLEDEFDIDTKNSVDKREHDHDRFGYLSSHLIVSLDAKRLEHTEYKKFENLKFEIQIRTILEDAWAETEHKLNYKSKTLLSYDKKRMLSRIAATLELIDESFTKLNEIENQTMTYDELLSFISNNSTIKDIDKSIRKHPYKFYDDPDIWSFDLLIKSFRYLKIYTIDDLQEQLNNRKKKLLLFIEQVLDKTIPIKYTNGISLIYLCILIIVEKNSKEEFINYLNNTEIRFGQSAEVFYKVIKNCFDRSNLIEKFDIKGSV